MSRITSCYKCPKRNVGCHASCPDHAKDVAENAKRNALIRHEKDMHYDFSLSRVCDEKLKKRKVGRR